MQEWAGALKTLFRGIFVWQTTGTEKYVGFKKLKALLPLKFFKPLYLIYSSFCAGFFSVFFYAYASLFYDAFFSYHKAY
jgi:hypothetical protein